MNDLPTLTPSAWLRWDTIESHIRELRPDSVLEFGAGGGAAGARLAALTSRYVGLEPDATARALAVSRMPAGAVVVSERSEIPEGRFDVVCAFEVIEHIEDDATALGEWAGHLVPGGHVLLSAPAFARRMGPMDRRVGHHRRYDPEDLARLLETVGFVDVEVSLIGFPLGYLLEAGRNTIARLMPERDSSMEERSAESGRLLQPPDLPWLTDLATRPFRAMQRLVPDRGTGVVALGRWPH